MQKGFALPIILAIAAVILGVLGTSFYAVERIQRNTADVAPNPQQTTTPSDAAEDFTDTPETSSVSNVPEVPEHANVPAPAYSLFIPPSTETVATPAIPEPSTAQTTTWRDDMAACTTHACTLGVALREQKKKTGEPGQAELNNCLTTAQTVGALQQEDAPEQTLLAYTTVAECVVGSARPDQANCYRYALDKCMAILGAHTGNVAYCMNIETQTIRESSCLFEIARDFLLPDACANITTPNTKNGCYLHVIPGLKQNNACARITDEAWVQACVTYGTDASDTEVGTLSATTPGSLAIVIYNEYSPEQVRLIKNTRFVAPNGDIYRIRESTYVPGYSYVNNQLVPGTIEATVYPDDPGGAQYSVPATYSIPGFLGLPQEGLVYGRTFTAAN